MVEWTLGLGLAWGGILVACTALNVVAALLLARSSLPARLEKRVARVQTETDAMGKAIEDFGRQHANNEAVIRGLVEEAQDGFERAERKRASAAATLSRRNGGDQQQQQPRNRAELIAMMRAKGAANAG